MAELFFNYLEYRSTGGSEDNALFSWQQHDDMEITAQAFWQAIRDAQEIAFNARVDNIPDALTPAEYKNKIGL